MSLNRIACPECGAGLKSASGFTPGQTVCCPKCETYFAVEDAPDATATAGGKKPVRAAASDDDFDDRPNGKKKRRDEEWSYKNSPARYAVLAVLVVIMCVLGYILYDKKMREADDAADNRPDDTGSRTEIPQQFAPPPKGLPVGVGTGGGGGKGGKKDPGTGGITPKQPNPGGGGGLPNIPLLGGGSQPAFPAAEADKLKQKYREELIGTWHADLGKGVAVELVYGADGAVKETVTTPDGKQTSSGKWAVTGNNGFKGIVVSWSGGTLKPATHRLTFDDGELEHPVSSQNVTGIFRKR